MDLPDTVPYMVSRNLNAFVNTKEKTLSRITMNTLCNLFSKGTLGSTAIILIVLLSGCNRSTTVSISSGPVKLKHENTVLDDDVISIHVSCIRNDGGRNLLDTWRLRKHERILNSVGSVFISQHLMDEITLKGGKYNTRFEGYKSYGSDLTEPVEIKGRKRWIKAGEEYILTAEITKPRGYKFYLNPSKGDLAKYPPDAVNITVEHLYIISESKGSYNNVHLGIMEEFATGKSGYRMEYANGTVYLQRVCTYQVAKVDLSRVKQFNNESDSY